MKIEDRLSNYMSQLHNDSATSAARMKANSGQTALHENDAVNVQLSASASQIADDRARLDKLNIIRQQLAEGSYNISGKDVAEKMLKILKG
ncbi:MAG: flagellar biosynthesis anti-sigma factor FlgM [Desulfuromonadales bacterium]